MGLVDGPNGIDPVSAKVVSRMLQVIFCIVESLQGSANLRMPLSSRGSWC